MELLTQKDNSKLFKRSNIDGNKVISGNQARNARPGSYGMIKNRNTGELAETRSDVMPEAYIPTSSPEPTPTEGVTEYDKDLMIADQAYGEFAQAYEQEVGEMPTRQVYEDYMQENPEDKPLEEAEAIDDIVRSTTNLKDYITQQDISMEDIYNMMPDGTDDRTFDLMMNPEKIDTEQEVEDVFMAIDMLADVMNIDTQKFFKTGEVEECGEECQALRRKTLEENGGDYDSEPLNDQSLTYKERLAILEEDE